MAPTPQPPSSAPLQILRLHQVCRITGLCRSVVYQLEAGNQFPKRVYLTERAVGWLEGEVQGWLAQRVAESRAEGRVQRSGALGSSPIGHRGRRRPISLSLQTNTKWQDAASHG